MLNRDIIELVNESTSTQNALGDPIYTRTYSQVFADKLSIRQSEFYQSNAQGLKPEFKFKIRSIDFGGQTQVRYPVSTGKIYDIMRQYSDDDEFIELTLQGVVANGNA